MGFPVSALTVIYMLVLIEVVVAQVCSFCKNSLSLHMICTLLGVYVLFQ